MLDQEIKTKILDTTFLARLNTGELLICILIAQAEGGLSLFFPYVIEDDYLEKFCPYAKNRRFEVAVDSIQFVKTPNAEIMDRYFIKMLSDQTKEFADFITFYRGIIAKQSNTITFPDGAGDIEVANERVLH